MTKSKKVRQGLRITAAWKDGVIDSVDVAQDTGFHLDIAGNPHISEVRWFEDYLAGKFAVWDFAIRLPSGVSGSILKSCLGVKAGELISYRDLGNLATSSANYARVVGNLMGKNCLPIIIPCHRVIKSDGGLGGFSLLGGLALKTRLLEHEGVIFSISE